MRGCVIPAASICIIRRAIACFRRRWEKHGFLRIRWWKSAPHPPFGHLLPARGEKERRAPQAWGKEGRVMEAWMMEAWVRLKLIFSLLPVRGEKVPEGRMRGRFCNS